MQTVAPRDRETLSRLLRRIDRKATYEVFSCDDGRLELRLALGQLKTNTRFEGDVLSEASENPIVFEELRGKIKRVYDRMRVPAPPTKMPKVEIQRDIAFGFAGHRRGGGRR